MNTPDDLPPNSGSAPVTLESLQQAYQNLRLLFHALILILLVLSGSVNIFLLREVSLVRRDVQDRQRFVDEYNRNYPTLISNVVARLQDFSRTNADFAPVLRKYGVQPTSSPAPGSPSARPMPKR